MDLVGRERQPQGIRSLDDLNLEKVVVVVGLKNHRMKKTTLRCQRTLFPPMLLPTDLDLASRKAGKRGGALTGKLGTEDMEVVLPAVVSSKKLVYI